jgi:hypothetical protein
VPGNETELLKSKNQRPRFDLPRLSIQLFSQISIFRLSLPVTVKEVTGFSRSLKIVSPIQTSKDLIQTGNRRAVQFTP